ncbi:MAG: hypothetical protein QXJ56_02365 [Ignisphaera sp.]|uniref:DUF11 domain-containing protein n=1 Tax=Ignisphaera aggregans TaxID=334771 RepID=A0A7J3JS91_9CREN
MAEYISLKRITTRAMSELLALVLGIAITVAVGMTLYTFIPNYLTSMQQQQKIALVVHDVFSVSSSEAILTLSIRNLGTKEVKAVNITMLSPVNLNVELIAPSIKYKVVNSTLGIDKLGLPPGHESILTIRLKGSDISVGSKVVITVSANYIDGSTASASAQALIV